MNFLSIFVLIPLLMLAGLWAARGIKAIRGVMVTGASALLIASVVLTFLYLGERSAGNTAEMLFRADTLWYAPLHISYSVGVDGISVAMLLLSAVIVFTGTFASWRLQPLTKEYFLWFTLLSMGVFGFFISVDLFTMFMFYEIALIPMYLLIGVWGSGRKEYAAMKLTLMLMGGSAFLLIGILGIYFGSGATTMNLLEIAQLHNIPFAQQCIWFPLTFLGFGVLNLTQEFRTTRDFNDTLNQALACSIVRVSFTCKQELYRIIRIVHDLRKTIQVGEQQVCTFVSSKTTAETNQQCVRIDLIHQ